MSAAGHLFQSGGGSDGERSLVLALACVGYALILFHRKLSFRKSRLKKGCLASSYISTRHSPLATIAATE
jgi:hypothetical protein